MPDQSSAASEHALMQEITVPLETLPEDPLAVVEAEFPTAMRGYDRHAVDDYVDQVTRLVSELHATRSPEAAVRKALERVGDQISGILQRAHETAEQITTQSRAEAEDRLEQARREAATMVDAAAQRVRELDADADRIWAERQRIVTDAEDLAVQLQVVARDATARFPADPADDEVRIGSFADPAEAFADDEEPVVMLEDARPAGPAAAADVITVADEDAPAEEIEADAGQPAAADEPDADEAGADRPEEGDETPEAGADADDDIEATRRFEPPRLTDDDSTQIIPPSSDAAQHRRDG